MHIAFLVAFIIVFLTLAGFFLKKGLTNWALYSIIMAIVSVILFLLTKAPTP